MTRDGPTTRDDRAETKWISSPSSPTSPPPTPRYTGAATTFLRALALLSPPSGGETRLQRRRLQGSEDERSSPSEDGGQIGVG